MSRLSQCPISAYCLHGTVPVCFAQMYQVLGTVVYLAMSGDTTCRGLRSPRDGSLVMEFTKGKTWEELRGKGVQLG